MSSTKSHDHMLVRIPQVNTVKNGSGDYYHIVCNDDGIIKTELVASSAIIGSVKVTDGTNFMPTMDVAARAGFQKVTNGTNVANVPLNDGVIPYNQPALEVAAGLYAMYGVNWYGLFLSDATNRNLNVRVRSGALTVGIGQLDTVSQNIDQSYGLVTSSLIFGRHDDTTVLPVRARSALSDSDPNLDGMMLLGTHALLSARKDASTTIGLTCLDSTHNALHVAISDGLQYCDVAATPYPNLDTENALVVAALVHGEDLDVGAGNSEPVKIRASPADDSGLPEAEKHLIVYALLHVKSGDVWIPWNGAAP